jgi:hypothetical protein
MQSAGISIVRARRSGQDNRSTVAQFSVRYTWNPNNPNNPNNPKLSQFKPVRSSFGDPTELNCTLLSHPDKTIPL